MLRASARAGVGAAGLALVGCGGDDDDDDAAVADQVTDQADQVDQVADQVADQQMEEQTLGAIDYPVPPQYSALESQGVLRTHHWSVIGPQTRQLGTPQRGGVFSMPAAGFGLSSLHPTEEVVGQWPFSYTHNNILGMSFALEDDPDRVVPTSSRGLA
ncbi:MAG: hypothetical protein O7A71_08055, partial [Chloroflexi bacterium]|nr:hypothetical protein [Chloroflexota bacterium]